MIDTHFHFKTTFSEDIQQGALCLETMVKEGTRFGLDIGTHCDDLFSRVDFIRSAIELIQDEETRCKARNMIHFSAGIWPAPEAISNRYEEMKTLERYINEFANDEVYGSSLCALGEGGIDHHWNASGVDNRDENDFNSDLFAGERELFEMQLQLAKKYNLPFIIHSRDGFEDTVDCVKNADFDYGILHCCSYPLEQVKFFVDRGWYVSFSGSVTYTKKAKMEDMISLLRYIPDDRILLETDSPYLSPVPLRGQPNNPVNVKHTYDFVASAREVDVQKLEDMVWENCKKLFRL